MLGPMEPPPLGHLSVNQSFSYHTSKNTEIAKLLLDKPLKSTPIHKRNYLNGCTELIKFISACNMGQPDACIIDSNFPYYKLIKNKFDAVFIPCVMISLFGVRAAVSLFSCGTLWLFHLIKYARIYFSNIIWKFQISDNTILMHTYY